MLRTTVRTLEASPPVRFGPYEVNLDSGDLQQVRLQGPPPTQIISCAARPLEHPGELVTREELKVQLWAENTFVEFESSLNVAVRRLREALGDEAQHPVYIETVPRHGYRFVGVIEKANLPQYAEPCRRDIAVHPSGTEPPLLPSGFTFSSSGAADSAASAQQVLARNFWKLLVPAAGGPLSGACRVIFPQAAAVHATR